VNSGQPAATNVVYIQEPRTSDDLTSSLIIFIAGWFLCCIWAVGFKYVKSRDTSARALAIASVVLFFFGLVAVIIVVIIEAVLVSAAEKAAADNNCNYYGDCNNY